MSDVTDGDPTPMASSLSPAPALAVSRGRALIATGAVGGFFALKVLVGLALVIQSARALSVSEFGIFSQLFLFLALLSTVSAGGVQSGLIRQIAAAENDRDRERRSVAAALVIWASFGTIVLVVALLAAASLSELLVGSDRARVAVPIIAAAALGAGGGQLLCAVLTGRGSPATSLALQGVGLVVGGAACWSRLAAGDAMGAVTAYAGGPLLTLLASLPFAWRWLPRGAAAFRHLAGELRLLLGFSATFLLTATIMPATLFALRYAYRAEFGEEALGYWLAANRVSDVSSQLIGLYMGQIYLPAATRAVTPLAARSLARRTILIGFALMGTALCVFVTFAPWLVRTFLSAPFLPAIPFITGYLIGDTFRVITSLALHTALARGKLRLYIGTEATTAILVALYVMAFTMSHFVESAYWGYAVGQATMAALVWLGWRRLVATAPSGIR